MTTDTQRDTLKEFRRLEAEATPGPWVYETGSIAWMIRERPSGPQVGNVICVEDRDLIVAARNALPLLLDVAEAARAVHCIVPSDPCDAHADEAGFRRCDQCRVMDALVALDKS